MTEIAQKYLGSLVDLTHHGHIVVADTEGRICYSYGDPERVTFLRSSAKPLQALAVAQSGALEHYGITDRELAVMCASHNGEPFHVEAVRSILAKAGLSEHDLRCGAQYPMYVPAEDALKLQGVPRMPIYCDCSGKHAGMLITAAHNGESIKNYDAPSHPVQKRILSLLAEWSGMPKNEIVTATDGCGVPVHAMPLFRAARMFARLAQPDSLPAKWKSPATRVVNAMAEHPEMIAGSERFCTELVSSFGARLIGKSGAGAFYAVGIRERGLGIAVKMEEGASQIIPYAVLETLVQMEVITRAEADALPCYRDKQVYNSKKEAVGRIAPVFRLNHVTNPNLF